MDVVGAMDGGDELKRLIKVLFRTVQFLIFRAQTSIL